MDKEAEGKLKRIRRIAIKTTYAPDMVDLV